MYKKNVELCDETKMECTRCRKQILVSGENEFPGSIQESVNKKTKDIPSEPRRFLQRAQTGNIFSQVFSVAFSPDNKTLASASRDKTVKLWDVSGATPNLKATFDQTFGGHSSGVNSVAFSHDHKTLASGSEDKTVKL